MREQLRCLRSGKHPKTLQSIPPPIPLRQWEAINANKNNQPPDDTMTQRPPPNITDDGTSFTQAFLRRGRPDQPTSGDPDGSGSSQTKRSRTTPMHRLQVRIALDSAEARGMKRSLEQFLSKDELDDPDLITFWVDDIPPSPLSAPPLSPLSIPKAPNA